MVPLIFPSSIKSGKPSIFTVPKGLVYINCIMVFSNCKIWNLIIIFVPRQLDFILTLASLLYMIFTTFLFFVSHDQGHRQISFLGRGGGLSVEMGRYRFLLILDTRYQYQNFETNTRYSVVKNIFVN